MAKKKPKIQFVSVRLPQGVTADELWGVHSALDLTNLILECADENGSECGDLILCALRLATFIFEEQTVRKVSVQELKDAIFQMALDDYRRSVKKRDNERTHD